MPKMPTLAAALVIVVLTSPAKAADCPVGYAALAEALKASVKPSGGPSNGGFDNNEWAAVVARDGSACAVAKSGDSSGSQWPASRAIALEKANTANGMSLPTYAVSTANLYAGSQPGGFLYAALETNPPNAAALYKGPVSAWGTDGDPMVGEMPGGVVVFGGGLPLYDKDGKLVGALGASGDTSCADHNIAWRIRARLALDNVPDGVSDNGDDAIIYDIGKDDKSASGFGHPVCGGAEVEIAQQLKASAKGASPFRASTAEAKLKKP